MKTTRDQLKSLIKECLIEILSESSGNVQAPRPAVGRQQISGAAVSESRRRPTFDPRLDVPVTRSRQTPEQFREAVKREAGGNPVMADILADTARTTLPSMMSHGDSGPGYGSSPPPLSQQEQFHGTPEEVFGEAAMMRPDGSSHWADLAFAPAVKKTA